MELRKELSIREQCSSCGAVQDRDVNAAEMILTAGPVESQNGREASRRTTPVVTGGNPPDH